MDHYLRRLKQELVRDRGRVWVAGGGGSAPECKRLALSPLCRRTASPPGTFFPALLSRALLALVQRQRPLCLPGQQSSPQFSRH